jgi:hypothetical protein
VWAYSPGRSRKKNPKVSMSASAVERGCWAKRRVVHVVRRTCIGIGFTLLGGGSFLL